MSNEANRPPQTSLVLRVLGGGYLVYLAWDLRASAAENSLFLIAVLVFALVGAALCVHSVWTLANHGYFKKDPIPENEITEDCEERSDD